MRLHLSALTATLAAGLTVHAAAQSPAQAPAAPTKATASINGRVVGAPGTNPLDQAIVTIESATGGDQGRRRQMVDGQGRFQFSGLPGGRYRIRSHRFGYLEGAYRRAYPGAPSGSLDLAEGQQAAVEILMWKQASISGRVVDEAGEPLVAVDLQLLRRGFSLEGFPRIVRHQVPGTRTDDRGAYRIGTLPPGEYLVVVPARVATVPIAVWTAPSAQRGETFGAIAEVSPLGYPRNIQIGDHVVAILNSAPVPPAPAREGMLPVYRNTFHPAATASQEATTISLAVGEDRTDVDIRLTPVQTSRVSGQIVGPEGPLAAVSLRLMQAGGLLPEGSDWSAASGLTDANGRFTLLGVPHGNYILSVMTPNVSTTGQLSNGKSALWVREPLTVGQADVTGVLLTARAAPTIRGRVEVSAGRTVAPGSITVVIQGVDSASSHVSNPRVEKDYSFVAELPPGRYAVTAFTGADTWCTNTTASGREISDEPVELRERSLADVIIACGAEPTRLAGTVRNERDGADDEAMVVFFSADRRHWEGALPRTRRFGSVSTTTTGSYSVVNVAPGEYFVIAIPGRGALVTNWRDPATLNILSRSATKVTVAAGESRSLDLQTVVVR